MTFTVSHCSNGNCFVSLTKNIDTQEQLRNALESLKQHQETINTLQMKISEETSKNLHTEENLGETKDEFQEKVNGVSIQSFYFCVDELSLLPQTLKYTMTISILFIIHSANN